MLNHLDDVLYICCVNNLRRFRVPTGGQQPKGPQKKQVPWQKTQSSQRIFHIFSVFWLFKDILVGGWTTHPKNISQVGSLKPPPRSDICIVYLSQKEVTSIDQPLHLNPCNCAPGLSVEISHQTGSLSSFLSDEIRTSHFTQPFLRLWGCCWPTGHS